jgi:hypothetical protein
MSIVNKQLSEDPQYMEAARGLYLMLRKSAIIPHVKSRQ